MLPNRLYETFEEGNDFYIVTELVEGGELFDRIVSKSHYNEKGARDLVKLMLETIDYVHQSGYVHRDLKPENLLLMSGEGLNILLLQIYTMHVCMYALHTLYMLTFTQKWLEIVLSE